MHEPGPLASLARYSHQEKKKTICRGENSCAVGTRWACSRRRKGGLSHSRQKATLELVKYECAKCGEISKVARLKGKCRGFKWLNIGEENTKRDRHI